MNHDDDSLTASVRQRLRRILPTRDPAPVRQVRDRLLLLGLDPGRPGVRVLAALVVLVAIGAGLLAWHSRPEVRGVPGAAGQAAPTGSGPGGSSGGYSFGSGAPGDVTAGAAGMVPDATASAAPTVVVAISGRVRRPGLVQLPAGARVADAVEAAGGALPGTDLSQVNLARRVNDGELVVIEASGPAGGSGGNGGGSGGGSGGGGGAEDPAAAGGPVNLNTATADQLQALPGVGPVLAGRIIDYRDQHNGFRTVADLRQVSGIGDKRFQQLKDLVTV